MPKMTKYQLEHFESKVKRTLNPLIEEQELLVNSTQLKRLIEQVRNLQLRLAHKRSWIT